MTNGPENPHASGPPAKWMVFAGAPFVSLPVIVYTHRELSQVVGETPLPYVITGIIVVFFVIAMALFERIPRKLVTPIGLAGWTITVTLLCWYFWFGPGALKM
jgi:hypothetical protein